MLSEKTKRAILDLQEAYPEKRSALIPALHLAQAEVGYLPAETQMEVAELFGIEVNEINAIVSFYDMFFDQPVGKHLIHICKNVSCMLRGSDEVTKKLCDKLQIQPGQTSADGEFTVILSECLASCDLAPMMLVDEKIVGPIHEDNLDQILEEAKKGPGHPAPVEIQEADHG